MSCWSNCYFYLFKMNNYFFFLQFLVLNNFKFFEFIKKLINLIFFLILNQNKSYLKSVINSFLVNIPIT